ncbi:MAG: ABC transporter permease [Chloroflexi bacterium]|nr:ABC transporter permease [Chloroflexota bacterium]
MRNFWLVAKHEYKRMVFRRAFVLLTLAIPLGFALIIGLSIAVAVSQDDSRPLGYVDYSDTLDSTLTQSLPNNSVGIISFADEPLAQDALEEGVIQAYFVLPSSYPADLSTDLYYLDEPISNSVWGDFDDFVRLSLLADYSEAMQERLFDGPSTIVKDIATGREFSESAIINIVLPFIATFLFFIATMAASGYMLQIVADEKENRTMEIMITSVTPMQLIGGKIAGLLAAALTQLGTYVLTAVIGLIIAIPRIEALQQFETPWGYLAVMIAFFLPAYLLISALMVAVGSAVTELQQGQQVAGILNLLFTMPLFLMALLFQNPSHPILIFMSYFPTTSFLTISLRWGVSSIPLWQITISWLILVGTTAGMIWAASRIFRVGMLQYGQPLRFKTAVAALRSQK